MREYHPRDARAYEIGIGRQENVIGITQGWKLTGVIKAAEVKLADGSLQHCNQRSMELAVPNARVESKGTTDSND